LTRTSIVVVGTHAIVTGVAMHNGVQATFTIDADDFGGKGRDTFARSASATANARSGVLRGGNLIVS
jgi:hypothetical protein